MNFEIVNALNSRFEELDQMWKETRETVTPRRRESTQDGSAGDSESLANKQTKIIQPAALPTEAAIVLPVAKLPAAKVSLERKPSSQRMTCDNADASVAIEDRTNRSLQNITTKTLGDNVLGRHNSTSPCRSVSLQKRSSPSPSKIRQFSSEGSAPNFCHHCGFDLRTCKIPPKFCRECGIQIKQTSSV